MQKASHFPWLVFGLVVAFGLTPTVAHTQAADITIPAGTDLLYTQPGTFATFPAPIGTVPLVGNPVLPSGADTEVQRLADADATTGAPINTMITSLNLLGPGGLSVTLDPANLANDTGTMSFLLTTPPTPGTEVGGTIIDTLNVYYLASIAGVPVATGHESFTSTGTWEAFLPVGTSEVTDFKIILDTHVAPGFAHVVSSFPVPEPSTWIMLAAAGVMVPAYAVRRRRRRA
jgi:hypothetical protein